MREVDRKLGLIRDVSRRLEDGRQLGKVRHGCETMLRQRVMALIAGWEDLNDARLLRHDPVHQVAAGADEDLASAATLCQFENGQTREAAWAVNVALVEQFIASHRKAPPVLVLDFDATDTPVHGKQEGRFFHGYYDCHCFLPLYVFCGDQLLVAYLRRSNIDAARHAAAILKLLVVRLRQAWPRTKIVFRADSGFCRDLLLSWCDRHEVKYVVGIARNERLLAEAPARFHPRFFWARWGVVLRRLIPTFTAIGLIVGTLLLPKMSIGADPGFWLALHYLPIAVLGLAFTLQELPRFEIPPWPRPRREPSWRVPREASNAAGRSPGRVAAR